MTLDELPRYAMRRFEAAHSTFNCTEDRVRAAVLAVLDAVERECVPARRVTLRDSAQEAEHGWDACRAEMLRRIAEMKR